ncbi:MAG: chemotaxis protein CheW [Meiothermus sp.]|uniref:chemotaxis protein CheW n=1 Tax=Meiothermus sp. TaxID=1955249 RepID=UPI0025E1DAF4|nr:chemotaxis protein CheW [Meiothermus sp.]MCS7068327.1 chemotaxis protein CheW [Meiothermus sp.]MDW8425853.1 chemotaxis protein CheW [Meiothermus sp.]
MMTSTISKIWVLRLGSTFLGVEPRVFKEVLEVSQPTPVPLAPAPLLGLVSNQGQIVPVFDLSHTLQIAPAGSGIAALLEFEGQPLAFMIDEVMGLRTNLSGAWFSPSQDPLFSALLEEDGKTVQILEVRQLFAHLSVQMSTPAQTSATPSRLVPQA